MLRKKESGQFTLKHQVYTPKHKISEVTIENEIKSIMLTSNCVRMVSISPASPGARTGAGTYFSVLFLVNFLTSFDFFSSFFSLAGEIRPLDTDRQAVLLIKKNVKVLNNQLDIVSTFKFVPKVLRRLLLCLTNA